ncbi:peptidase domain-containing ABC transporter [Terrimonas sp. NA20]|uniref:Peptidase domain-containing ABC transporter n=1 Tax=Terrimonas ginsenosidimutans TaxID=2908004 RepID=A0ABS9KK72_9BACT|nr:peptidase domain-containing ABC transporter [Terrimonas ginsenosidimutans]MCG2612719.1 peptidase domain-containing ABC transporter [Terrimonas ginsenosidimutans]
MSFPFYKQPDTMDCGPTCLRMVAKFYKRSISLQHLRDLSQIGKEGVNLLGIGEAAEAVGFRTHSYKLTYQSLVKDAKLPAILHWNQNHFVVLYKVKGTRLYIADPAKGLLHYTAEEFCASWISDPVKDEPEGIALLLEPSPLFYEAADSEDESPATGTLKFKNILGYILPYKKLVFQLFVGLGVGSLLQLFLPFLTQSIVDTGVNTANIHFVYIVLLAQLALFAGRMVIEFVRGWILLHISTRINISILTDFLVKLMKLPMSYFDSKHTGDILQRMNDHQRIESFLTGSSLSVLFSLVNLVVFSIVLAIFNTGVFFVFASASILYAVWVILFLKKRKALDYKRFDVTAKEQSATIQLVQGMQEIKLNGAERPMRWKWERLQAKIFRLNMKGLSLNQWQQAGAFFINEGKNILITFFSAKAVIDGEMTLGAMLAIQYIIGQLNSPVEQMIGFVQSWQNARISLDRLNEVHAMPDEEPREIHLQKELPASFTRQLIGGTSDTGLYDASAVKGFAAPSGASFGLPVADAALSASEASDGFPLPKAQVEVAIHFWNLSFTYPGAGNTPVLHDINLSIPRGKTTAIVGTSGSGKTTLLKLLLKFYQPQKGEIRLGETPLSHISHKQWRSHCGVVMQESYIFSDTIAKNIAVGQERIDMERLQHATMMANLQEFIESLPLGYQTKIGQEGTGISMGQKQRILIARAVYRDPDFIFFDEATNSLDANNETLIVKNLQAFFKGRTVVVVAHRLSTVKHADQIIVLDKGVIAECGTHQELTNLRSAYYQLVKNQLELGE